VRRWFCPALPKMIRGQSRQAGDVSPKIWLPSTGPSRTLRNESSSLEDFLKEEGVLEETRAGLPVIYCP
jgi:hypothetical protein